MPKVLLADDSTHAQRMGTQILSAENIQVVTVSNGEAAVKKLPDGDFDVVLADVFMPGRSGYEVCSFIKKSPKFSHIPVVLMVGQLEPYDPDQAKKAQADAVLEKPLKATEVVKTVRAMLELARERRPAPPPPPPTPAEVAAAEAQDQQDLDAIPTTRTASIEVPEEMKHQAAFDLFGEAPPAQAAAPAPPPAPAAAQEAAPAAPVYAAEPERQPASVYGVETTEAPAAMEQPATAPSAYAKPEPQPASVYGGAAVPAAVEEPAHPPVIEYGGAAESPAAMEDVSIPELLPPEIEEQPTPVVDVGREPAAVAAQAVAPKPVRRWMAEPEAVTDMDRAAFAGTATATVAAAAPLMPAAPAAPEPAAVPDWADLLKSVEEPTAAPAKGVPVEIEPAPPAPVVAAAPAPEPTPAAAPPPAPVAAPEPVPVATAAPALDPAALRAAVESALDKTLPNLKAVPGVVDTMTAEILRCLSRTS